MSLLSLMSTDVLAAMEQAFAYSHHANRPDAKHAWIAGMASAVIAERNREIKALKQRIADMDTACHYCGEPGALTETGDTDSATGAVSERAVCAQCYPRFLSEVRR
jgi:DNA-binding helix-hairpin-helix protein with protein kinase domain